jgi:hypothetical protein
MMMEEGQERVRAAYRDNYTRLARIKAQYDPTNFFHVNQNIEPARHLVVPEPRIESGVTAPA